MTAALLLGNLLAWSAQVAILVTAAAFAAMTISHPRARLLFWQGILVIALLLPAVEPWRQPPTEPAASSAIAAANAPVIFPHPSASRFTWRKEYLLGLLAAGAALRFLWIGAGLFRLRRHRLDARMLTTPPVRFSNPRVRWFVSATVGGPVTFGFLNPSILLPARVVSLPDDLREAIAHHELAHVRRRDWLFVLVEEALRSLLWFHPAIWFVLSRIQLAREQVVDAEVVGLTRDRERYLDALVAVAAQKLLPDVAPAPLFLKKRQLAIRVAAVLKETRMSKARLFMNLTAFCSSVGLAVSLAVWMFPLNAPAQTPSMTVRAPATTTVADGPGIVVEPGAKILHRPPVFYPHDATATGTVIVDSTVNQKGEVTDAHIVSGPDELRGAVLSSVLNWHFSTDQGLGQTVQSVIRFTSAPASTRTADATTRPNRTPSVLKAIRTVALPDELDQKVRAALPVHVGDTVGESEAEQVNAAVQAVDEHLRTAFQWKAGGEVTLTVLLPSSPVGGVMGKLLSEPIMDSPAVAADFPAAPAGVARIRVGGQVQAANLTKKVVPVYPPLAKQARVQGLVQFSVLIGTDGSVAALQLIQGHPLLVQAARDAVAQWQYRPTLLNGVPAQVATTIDINFTLSDEGATITAK